MKPWGYRNYFLPTCCILGVCGETEGSVQHTYGLQSMHIYFFPKRCEQLVFVLSFTNIEHHTLRRAFALYYRASFACIIRESANYRRVWTFMRPLLMTTVMSSIVTAVSAMLVASTTCTSLKSSGHKQNITKVDKSRPY